MRIIVRYGDGCPIYKLKGRLDLNARERLRDSIESVWNDCQRLRLDLSEVDDVDFTGLTWLMLAYRHAHQRGAQFEMVATSSAVLRALKLFRPATRHFHHGSRAALGAC